jgi:hypothetical protein
MLKNQDSKQSLIGQETILKAVQSLKDKGWDINPYTVADELNVSRSVVYRSVEAMNLIVEERRGTFGIDVAASLDLARQIQELERRNADLIDKLKQTRPAHDSELNETEIIIGEQRNPAFSQPAALLTGEGDGGDPRPPKDYDKILDLSWRDIEAIYNSSVLSFPDYATAAREALKRQLPLPSQENLPINDSPHQSLDPIAHLAPKLNELNIPPHSITFPKLEANQLGEPVYFDSDISGPHYQFVDSLSPVFQVVQSSQAEAFAKPIPEDVISTASETSQPVTGAPELPWQNHVDGQSVTAAAPDLDSLDIFDGLDNIEDLQRIEVIADVDLSAIATDEPVGESALNPDSTSGNSSISTEELRNLINSRIKPTAEQVMDQSGAAKSAEDAKAPQSLRSRFIGSGKAQEASEGQSFVLKTVPADIRKACLLLGIRPEDLSPELVQDSWKRQIAAPGVHPDQGGDTESAIYLNTAKDALLHWLEAQAPKLGKRFKQAGKEPGSSKHANDSDKDR